MTHPRFLREKSRPNPDGRHPSGGGLAVAGLDERTCFGVVIVEARGKGQSGSPNSGFEFDMHFADQANRG